MFDRLQNNQALIWRVVESYARRFPIGRGKTELMRLAARKLGEVRVERDGVEYELRIDQFIDSIVFRDGGFEPEVHEALRVALAGGGTFVDIGANFGYFTCAAATLPGTRVIALEPSPRELLRLYRQLEINNLHNVFVFPVAAAANDGEANLLLADRSNPGRNSMVDADSSGSIVRVQTVRLDTVIPREWTPEIRAVKIDVEGFEAQVIAGAAKTLREVRDCSVIVEVSQESLLAAGSSGEEVYRLMSDLGFAARGSMRKGTSYYNEVFRKG